MEVGRRRRRRAVLLPEPAMLLLVLLLLRLLVMRRPGHEAGVPAAGALRVQPTTQSTLHIVYDRVFGYSVSSACLPWCFHRIY